MKTSVKRKINKKAIWGQRLFLLSITIYPIILFVIFYIVVNANSILLAFQELDTNYTLKWVGIKNFKQVFSALVDPNNISLRRALTNSILRFVIMLIIGMPLNMLFGFLIYRKKPGTRLFRLIIMLPNMISGMIMALMFQRLVYELPSMMQTLKINNFPNFLKDTEYVFGTAVFYSLWTGFTSAVIIYPNVMNSISSEIIESARLDGCTGLREVWFIIVPLIRPTISTFFITGIAGIFVDAGPNFTFWGLVAPPEAGNMGYYLFQKVLREGTGQYGFSAALGILLTVITLPATMFVKWLFERTDPLND